MSGLTEKQRNALREVVHGLPLLDSHAHNIVPIDSSFPFLRCFSEAENEAMKDVPFTLSFKRSIRDIASLYGCEASLQSIEAHRKAIGINEICCECFDASNISTVLIDDGIVFDKMFDLEWHRKYIPAVHRVLRIETVAEAILEQGPPGGITWTLDSFAERFIAALKSLSNNVVAFKSIAAYRSGLQIDPSISNQAAEEGLRQNLQCISADGRLRIHNKSVIDFIFTHALEVATMNNIPMQIHTGFGDKDLDLRLANPLHLHSILEDKRFLNCHLVLLHAAYPYSKEASYLASVYPQVYLDFGLAVPKLSVRGMHSAVRELLELAPLNKVMFSTDGYAFPETYFLGAKWARKVVFDVLCEACSDGDLSFEESLQAADCIFERNAATLYNIRQLRRSPDCEARKANGTFNCKSSVEISQDDPSIKFVRLVFADGSGQRRCRVVPKARFEDLVCNEGVGLTRCCMGMTSYADAPAEGSGLGPTGEIRLMPDVTTQQRLPWLPEHELVLVDMHVRPGTPWEYCPRATLFRVSEILLKEFGLVMHAGFESEFYILKPNTRGDRKWEGFDSMPYCSSAAFDGAASILTEIYSSVTSMGIPIEQIHAEAGGGQFEFALGHFCSTKAADNLLIFRDTVKAIVSKNGLLATFLPKYFLNDIGSGSHVHLSLYKGDTNVFIAEAGNTSQYGMSKMGEGFMAGVLHHLPSILVFTAPMPNSYERIKPNTWSGAYQCWGRENREAPIRTACPPGTPNDLVSNFELKGFDGCANPHLGLAAIMAAGIDGLRKHLLLPEPVDVNPATIDGHLVHKLPTSLDQALEALHEDGVIKSIIGPELVTAIIAIRQAEIHFTQSENTLDMLAVRY
eukprot:c28779_g1_i1 orf=272-2839(-)